MARRLSKSFGKKRTRAKSRAQTSKRLTKVSFLGRSWRFSLRRLLFIDGVFLLAWIAIGCAIWFFQAEGLKLKLPNVLGTSSDITTTKVFDAINTRREKNGIKKLTWNDQLAQAAQSKADDMLANNYWSHTTPDNKQPWVFVEDAGYHYRVAGENLARNFRSTDAMVGAWMNSPSHRANLLHDSYQETGIAVVNGVLDGEETTLVVQMFGTPATSVLTGDIQTQAVSVRGEIAQIAPNIARWLTTSTSGQGTDVLGVFSLESQVAFYRTGMLVVVGTTILLLVVDSFRPSRRSRSRHPLLYPGKHFVHIALLVITLLTVGLAEVGSLL